MRVLVAGATGWSDDGPIRREMAKLPVGSAIIYGDARGADALAGEVAQELGLAVEPMVKNADDYARYQRGAWKGLNERMLASNIHQVWVFHADLAASTGSKHLVKLAREANIETHLFAE